MLTDRTDKNEWKHYLRFAVGNFQKTGVNVNLLWTIVNKFYLIHDDDWTFTNMDTKIGSPTLYTWGLKLFTKATCTTFTLVFRLLLVIECGSDFCVQLWNAFQLSLFRVNKFIKFDESDEKLPVLSDWVDGKYHSNTYIWFHLSCTFT